jgi:hypothetical protein
MASSIEISTRRYERVHGRKPKGFGLWYFQLPGGRLFTCPGSFEYACRAAADHVRAAHLSAALIQVCA